MIVLAIVLTVIVAVLLVVLLTPLVFEIDTTENVYRISLRGLVKVWPGIEGDSFCLHIQVPFKHFRVTKFTSTKKPKEEKPKKKLFRQKSSLGAPTAKQMLAVVKSIKIRDFRLQLDTDDFARNGQLYPLFYWVNEQGLDCSVNFQGENHLSFTASTSLMKMGWAWIRNT